MSKTLREMFDELTMAVPFTNAEARYIPKIKVALEKQIPKRPRVDDDSWYCCPRCDETFAMFDKFGRKLSYCGACGQKLDWSKADAQKRSDTNDRT